MTGAAARRTEPVGVTAWLDACRPLLPFQNPLWSFIHNNVLMAFEPMPFGDAVREAAALYRARAYETEEFYREELSRGRIGTAALDAVLRESLPDLGADRVERFLADASLGDDGRTHRPLRLALRFDGSTQAAFDRRLQDFLVPLVAAWFDQGMTGWANPYGRGTFWAFFVAAVRASPSWGFDWAGVLKERLAGHERAGRSVAAVIAVEVEGTAPAGREADYCLETFFAMKGWSGLVHQLEQEPSVAPVEAPPPALADWLAALLLCTHALEQWLVSRGTTETLRPPARQTGHARLQLWQEAYERSFAGPFLAWLESAKGTRESRAVPAMQAMVCMDDREESFRRALERPEVGIEIWGVVGFFGVDMSFRAVGTARATRQCPPVVEPSRTIHEEVVGVEVRGAGLRRETVARASLAGFYHSRTLVRGFLVSAMLGLASFVPLFWKVWFPAGLKRLRGAIDDFAFPRSTTRIVLDGEGGYSVEEQADIVRTVLSTCGLAARLAPLVAVVGHGSTTTNNPYRQAYGCGACSGNRGAPNARAFAQMANDPSVRALLDDRGLRIPASTMFVPYLHDTTADTIELLDEWQLDPRRAAEVRSLTERLVAATRFNAQERLRRFAQAPVDAGAEEAVQHAADRAHDLAQPRPELGHSRVAACIVGRRELTRSLDLDRRTFLVSYDHTRDPDGRWLASAVLGSVPVAVNIAMDYFYSRVDPDGFGSGSKLPLNVVGLLGVCTGSKSDLRIGLARQMAELHEPMRHLVLIETTEERLRGLVAGNARLTRLATGGWMRLGRVDPESREVTLLRSGAFVAWREALGWDEPPAAALPAVLDWRHDRSPEAVPC